MTAQKITTSPPLADQAYRVIREMITTGEYAAGERLTERAVAAQLGVSPTPVREAIARLEHERLLERPDGRALTVAAPSLDRLLELSLIETALRGTAARIAATKVTKHELEQIRAVNEQAKNVTYEGRTPIEIAREALALTRRFHDLIDQASHNPVLIDMIATATAFDLGLRIKAVELLGRDYPAAEGHAEHDEIVRALADRDPDRAEALMIAHNSRARELYLAAAEAARKA